MGFAVAYRGAFPLPSPEVGEPDWFPVDVRRMSALFGDLDARECQALLSALLYAWQAPLSGKPPCSIPAERTAFQRIVIHPADDVGAAIFSQFKAHPTAPGFLVCAWLLADYDHIQFKRKQKAQAGAAGGKASGKARASNPKRDKPLERSSNGTQPSSSCRTTTTTTGARAGSSEPPPASEERKSMADVRAYLAAHPEVVNAPPPTP